MDRTFSREEIIGQRSLKTECERAGLTFKKIGVELYAKCPFHADGGKPNFRYSEKKDTWFCDVCNVGGGVVEFVAQLTGELPATVFKRWAADMAQGAKPAASKAPEPSGPPKGEIVATYDYVDERGEVVYQVCRMHPKSFRQRHTVAGKWVWNMEGVTRVLYRLPDVRLADEVWVVEGEKDADNLGELGLTATCNVGGAGKWLDAYTATLAGKNVVLCGDNDDPGRAHMEKVLLSISESAKSVKIVKVPEEHKDVSDWIDVLGVSAEGTLSTAVEKAAVVGGYHLIPVKNMAELEVEYCELAKRMDTVSLDLARWLPSLSGHVRPIVPGELVMFLADTGTGKTALLQNLAIKAKVTTLLFEMELPGTLTFERFVAAATKIPCHLIEEAYRAGEPGVIKYEALKHVWCCNQAGLKIEDMKRLIKASALKIGEPPAMVMVDYVQLVTDSGRTRYERVSNAAEQLKVLAKDTNTIVVAASQVGRKDYGGGPQVQLHDGKNAGEIENSSGLVFGCWRDEKDAGTLMLKVLKNTKGRAGIEVTCNFNGPTMQITERSKVQE